MSTHQEYAALSIGAAADRAWAHARSGTISGITSRGLFLRTTSDRVLFLSTESQHGPLTLNLPPAWQTAQHALEIGTTVQFSARRLLIPANEIEVSISDAILWRTPRPAAPPRSCAAIKSTLRTMITAILRQRDPDEFGALLMPLLDRNVPPTEKHAALFVKLTSLVSQLAHHSPSAATCASDLLGRGRGLTPSGDDCLIGLLLALNRWQADRDWTVINRTIRDAAYQRTTTLSANLIECATQGEADERLIAALDGIVTGEPDITASVAASLAWGHSSGVAALSGMVVALSALDMNFTGEAHLSHSSN